MVISRDTTSIIPVMRDGANTGQPLTNITIADSGQHFTEMFNVGNYTELIAFCDVTANSGTTPTMDIRFQYSIDGKKFVDSGDAFAQVATTNGLIFKKLSANFGKYARLGIVQAGTSPSYTFSVVIQAKN